MTTSPRVRRIKVTGLFGIFDHEIPLNMDERITILHGPNGYGKTKILWMLDGLLRGEWSRFASVPFDTFRVELDNEHVLGVERKQIASSDGPPRILKALADIEFFRQDGLGKKTQVFSWETIKDRYRAEDVEGRVYRDELPSASEEVTEWFQEWLAKACGGLDSRLIETQRLNHEVSVSDEMYRPRLAVRAYSKNVAMIIKSTLAAYANYAQELDSTFLDRLFQPSITVLPMEQIEKRLRRLEEKRARLGRLGVLDPEHELQKKSPQLVESKLDVLTVYVEDTESKLAVLEDLSQRIELLTECINRRFAYKQMSVSREQGFVFHSLVNGASVPLDSLSSGEQHEIVLLYKLLFNVEPGSLVLIDEPEISLHLAWQNQFLSDVSQMVALGGYDVLVATHSPAIINDRWDLTVELKGPELPAKAAE
ncbi:AAA family ATPase [Polyangium sorediatum]|uniref:AAA family ATPase n=1 Tax=Polyangium sorediatum TaxID=889274 RepID=A0ABT6NKN4_9BACT|nr:AAA family ATPase [Polyangium sorediatum]MDI1428876.1 AAA family ATPase [Polyangium sorediatum]